MVGVCCIDRTDATKKIKQKKTTLTAPNKPHHYKRIGNDGDDKKNGGSDNDCVAATRYGNSCPRACADPLST